MPITTRPIINNIYVAMEFSQSEKKHVHAIRQGITMNVFINFTYPPFAVMYREISAANGQTVHYYIIYYFSASSFSTLASFTQMQNSTIA